MDEQIEVITIRMRERLRKCMTIVPLAGYILDSEAATVIRDLEEAEIGMVNNQEGLGNHQLPQKEQGVTLQRQTSKAASASAALEKKIEEARKMKKRFAKGQTKCHCCSIFMSNVVMFNCKACKSTICYACI